MNINNVTYLNEYVIGGYDQQSSVTMNSSYIFQQ